MPFLALLLTSPLVFIANSKKSTKEELILFKLFGIWMLCQLYITLNNSIRAPIGIICAILIVYNGKNNRKSKFIAIMLGFISLLLSSVVYLSLKL